MSHAVTRWVLAAALVSLTAGAAASAQQSSTMTETKAFEVIAVNGNNLVVKLPEGTKELTVAEDFKFTVDGQQMSVHQLKAGMKGTATITTKTTSHPVTVTEVKNGTVAQVTAGTIIVRTDDGYKAFTASELEKRGVKLMRNGEPAEISNFRSGDKLSATIITSKPPRIVTEKEVEASLAKAAAPAAKASGSAKSSGSSSASGGSGNAASTSSSGAASTHAGGSPSHTLPKTASSAPLVGGAGVALMIFGLALTLFGKRAIR